MTLYYITIILGLALVRYQHNWFTGLSVLCSTLLLDLVQLDIGEDTQQALYSYLSMFIFIIEWYLNLGKCVLLSYESKAWISYLKQLLIPFHALYSVLYLVIVFLIINGSMWIKYANQILAKI